MLEVVKEWLVAHSFQLAALELFQHFILSFTLEDLTESCLHHDVNAWPFLSLVMELK